VTTILLNAVFNRPLEIVHRSGQQLLIDREHFLRDGILQLVQITGFVSVHRLFRYPQRKKSHDEKSGDLGGHGTSPKRGFKRRIENCIQEDGRHLNDIIFHT